MNNVLLKQIEILNKCPKLLVFLETNIPKDYQFNLPSDYNSLTLDRIINHILNESHPFILQSQSVQDFLLREIQNKELYHELCKIILLKNSRYLDYVLPSNLPTKGYYNLCKFLLKNNGNILKYVDSTYCDTESYVNLCKIAIKQEATSIQFVKNIDLTLYSQLGHFAFQTNRNSLFFINSDLFPEEDYERLCKIASDQCNGHFSLNHINKTRLNSAFYHELCLKILRQNPAELISLFKQRGQNKYFTLEQKELLKAALSHPDGLYQYSRLFDINGLPDDIKAESMEVNYANKSEFKTKLKFSLDPYDTVVAFHKGDINTDEVYLAYLSYCKKHANKNKIIGTDYYHLHYLLEDIAQAHEEKLQKYHLKLVIIGHGNHLEADSIKRKLVQFNINKLVLLSCKSWQGNVPTVEQIPREKVDLNELCSFKNTLESFVQNHQFNDTEWEKTGKFCNDYYKVLGYKNIKIDYQDVNTTLDDNCLIKNIIKEGSDKFKIKNLVVKGFFGGISAGGNGDFYQHKDALYKDNISLTIDFKKFLIKSIINKLDHLINEKTNSDNPCNTLLAKSYSVTLS